MRKTVFEFLGRRIELWAHPEPDHLGRVIRTTRTFYELDVLMKCREVYLPGTTILDVGANIGNHAVFFAAILDAPVVAFEPFRPNYDLLELNIAANGLEGRIAASCIAIGEAVGMASAQAGPPENLGTTRVTFGGGDTPVSKLDGLSIPGPIGLIKVDVEGAELPVLRGAECLLQAWLPDLMIEAGTPTAFWCLTETLLPLGYAPRGRFAATPTWLFSATDQVSRMRRIMAVRS